MTEIPKEVFQKVAKLANAEDASFPLGAVAVQHSTLGRAFARYIADVSEKAKAASAFLLDETFFTATAYPGARALQEAVLAPLILPNSEDDLLKEAREICAQAYEEERNSVAAKNYRAGNWDDSLIARIALAALRKGRE